MEKVYHVANEFLKISNDQDCFDMNPMKLNRLVYYSHCWHLAVFGEPLINLLEQEIPFLKVGVVQEWALGQGY